MRHSWRSRPSGKVLSIIFPILPIIANFETLVDRVKTLFKSLVAFFKGEGDIGSVLKAMFNLIGPVPASADVERDQRTA